MKKTEQVLLTKEELETLKNRVFAEVKGQPVFDCTEMKTLYVPMIKLVNEDWAVMTNIKENWVK